METNHRDWNNQIEINDLIDAAISDALARRGINQENLSDLSDEDTTSVTGGINSVAIAGYLPIKPIRPPFIPPIVLGIILKPNYFL